MTQRSRVRGMCGRGGQKTRYVKGLEGADTAQEQGAELQAQDAPYQVCKPLAVDIAARAVSGEQGRVARSACLIVGRVLGLWPQAGRLSLAS